MKRVVIESPLSGPDREKNKFYARLCVLDCLRRNEAPYASHLLYDHAGILDDDKPEERRLGMEAGFAWGAQAQLVAVYADLGISKGMREGIGQALLHGIPWEERRLPEALMGRFRARYPVQAAAVPVLVESRCRDCGAVLSAPTCFLCGGGPG